MKLNLPTMPEPTDARYKCFNTGSVECEVAEFLFGLVSMIKPTEILETGTHKGISTAYMAAACKQNGFGLITTLEYEQSHWNDANSMFLITGLIGYINSLLMDSQAFKPEDNTYDFIFLDTEPNLRFDEMVRFWPSLKPGGFLAIHDLGPGMGQTGVEVNGMMDWPFGTMPEKMKEILRQSQSFHFKTPRGLFMCQKKEEGFCEV